MWVHFTDAEVAGLDVGFVAKLDQARGIADIPFQITCGRRTADHNTAVGGVSDSAHLTGHAVDLHAPDTHTAFRITSAALAVGIKRVGIYHGQPDAAGHVQPTHVHIDDDASLPPEVMWTGFSH